MSTLELPLGDLRPLRRHPPEPILRSASVEDQYRWTMERAWGVGPTIMWVLFNPSDADHKRDDPTTLRMMGFSYRWGFGSMIVANIYPFIAPQPKNLHAWRRSFDWKAYESNGMRPWEMDKSSWSAFHHNQGVISKLLTGAIADTEMKLVAAWGLGPADADLDHFLHGIRLMIDDDEFGMIGVQPNWHCLGTTADGSPIHPLARGRNRVPDDAKLKIWKCRPRRVLGKSGCA